MHIYWNNLNHSKEYFRITFIKKPLTELQDFQKELLSKTFNEFHNNCLDISYKKDAKMSVTSAYCALMGTNEEEFLYWLNSNGTKSFELNFNLSMSSEEMNKIPDGYDSYHDYTFDAVSYINKSILDNLLKFTNYIEDSFGIFHKTIFKTKDFHGDKTNNLSKKDYFKLIDIAIISESRRGVNENFRTYGRVFKGRANVAKQIGEIYTELRFETIFITRWDEEEKINKFSQVHPEKVDITFGMDRVDIKERAELFLLAYAHYLKRLRGTKEISFYNTINDTNHLKDYFDYNTKFLKLVLSEHTDELRKQLVLDEGISDFIKIKEVVDITDKDFLFYIASDPKYSVFVREAALSQISLNKIKEIQNKDEKFSMYIDEMLKNLPQSIKFIEGFLGLQHSHL